VAAVRDGIGQRRAAKIGGMAGRRCGIGSHSLQRLRAHEGLFDNATDGPSLALSEDQRIQFARNRRRSDRIVRKTAAFAGGGFDRKRVHRRKARASNSSRYVGKLLKKLGFLPNISARPAASAQDARNVEAIKKIPRGRVERDGLIRWAAGGRTPIEVWFKDEARRGTGRKEQCTKCGKKQEKEKAAEDKS